jgi:hypothetical protein
MSFPLRKKPIYILFFLVISVVFLLSFYFFREKKAKKTAPEIFEQISIGDQCEVRGAWICWDSWNVDATKRSTLLNKVKEANLNTVFLQGLPHKPSTEAQNYESFISEAKAMDISSHIWLESGQRLYWQTGEWVDYTDPAEPQAQADWALYALSQYPEADGIHLDYIRTAHNKGDLRVINSTGEMDGVTATVKMINDGMKSSFPGKFLTAAVLPADPKPPDNIDFNQSHIPQWFINWSQATGGQAPGGYSYGVYQKAPWFMNVHQNSPEWLSLGNIDAVIPMKYTKYYDQFQKDVGSWKSFLSYLNADAGRLYMGIGWAEASWMGNFDVDGIIKRISYGRSQGLKGFVIFRLDAPGAPDQKLINALKSGPCQTPIRSCLASVQASPTPTSTPSPTPASTPTPTPTPMPTSTPGPSPTPGPDTAQLTGPDTAQLKIKVSFLGRDEGDWLDIVEFCVEEKDWCQNVGLDENGESGQFSVEGITSGDEYTLQVKKECYLSVSKKQTLNSGDNDTIDMGEMFAGDLTGEPTVDNQINSLDWSIMKIHYGESGQ